ncbi:class I SAM-dependent methyltransferase [Streptomyces sp. NPDC046985]|uniref:class I SAM-dependent methyltransferase n=1 Tax=Streptomyces sp. NPDC046985 TaxID=3155377 RepID=UPI003408995F
MTSGSAAAQPSTDEAEGTPPDSGSTAQAEDLQYRDESRLQAGTQMTTTTHEGPAPVPAWRCGDITTSDLSGLPEPAYAVITCRLVCRWMDDTAPTSTASAASSPPGGTFRVVAETAGRREATDPRHGLGISPAESEALTSGWSAVQAADLDVLRCYALRP